MERVVIIELGMNGRIPEYKTKTAAAADLYSSEDVVLKSGERRLVRTELSMQMPEDAEAQVRGRSGNSLKGIDVKLGTIDSDYRGEVGVIMKNDSELDFEIKSGDRIAQLAFIGLGGKFRAKFIVGTIDKTDRGSGGFGHTGKRD